MKSFIFAVSPPRPRLHSLFFPAFFALAIAFSVFGQSPAPNNPSATREFCGSSPCDEPVRELLGISTNGLKEVPELIEWKLTLQRDPKTLAPATYELHCDYG